MILNAHLRLGEEPERAAEPAPIGLSQARPVEQKAGELRQGAAEGRGRPGLGSLPACPAPTPSPLPAAHPLLAAEAPSPPSPPPRRPPIGTSLHRGAGCFPRPPLPVGLLSCS